MRVKKKKQSHFQLDDDVYVQRDHFKKVYKNKKIDDECEMNEDEMYNGSWWIPHHHDFEKLWDK